MVKTLSNSLTLQPLLFWRKKSKGNPEKKQGFFYSRNPQNPWQRKEKRTKKQGKSENEKKGNRKKQGLEGQGFRGLKRSGTYEAQDLRLICLPQMLLATSKLSGARANQPKNAKKKEMVAAQKALMWGFSLTEPLMRSRGSSTASAMPTITILSLL